jgi:hypothetical protein
MYRHWNTEILTIYVFKYSQYQQLSHPLLLRRKLRALKQSSWTISTLPPLPRTMMLPGLPSTLPNPEVLPPRKLRLPSKSTRTWHSHLASFWPNRAHSHTHTQDVLRVIQMTSTIRINTCLVCTLFIFVPMNRVVRAVILCISGTTVPGTVRHFSYCGG